MKIFWMVCLMLSFAVGCSRDSAPEEAVRGKHYAKHVDQQNFRNEVLKSDLPSVVDFYATWCGPCRQVAPTLEQLAKEYEGTLNIFKVDVDKNPELAREYQVQSIPAFFAFKDGKLVSGKTGAMSKQNFKAWFNSLLDSKS